MPWSQRGPQRSYAGPSRLFCECFAEHRRMQSSDLWRRLPVLCAAVEDAPYLEQKIATVMAGVELLRRGALVEGGHATPERAEELTLPGLISMARGLLPWGVPKHDTRRERHRLIRNAAAHGGARPGPAEEVRRDLDKWRLFLTRRLLLRLGFTGDVASPEGGFAASSGVGDVEEGANTFGT
jgi:hypothetical protein